MKQGTKLYLVDCTECKIITATYGRINEAETCHLIVLDTNIKKASILLFPYYPNTDKDIYIFEKRINPSLDVLLKGNSYLSGTLGSHNLGNHHYHIFDNEKQAQEVFKTIIVPAHIELEEKSAQGYKDKYMAQITKIENLQKLLNK